MKRAVLLMLLALCACGEAPKGAPPQRKPVVRGHPPVPVPMVKEPVRVGGDVKAPVIIKRVEPDYSACGARQTRSLLILEAVIDHNGDVKTVRPLTQIDPCMERAFVAAARQWKFKPGTLNGVPVDVIYNFTLQIHLQ